MRLHRRQSSFLGNNGPESMEQLGRWDEFWAERFSDLPLMRGRLLENLRRPVFVATDFSGYDAPRECFRILTQTLAKTYGVPMPHVRFVRTCDNGAMQKRCLMSQSDLLDGGSSCVFSDVMDRLKPEIREWVSSAAPGKNMQVEEAQAANALVETFLQQPGDQLFALDGSCYCEMHRQRCPCHVQPVVQSMLQGASISGAAS